MLKVELVAAFAGVELHRPPFTWGLTQKTRRFLELSPTGKVSGHPWELHIAVLALQGAYPCCRRSLAVRGELFVSLPARCLCICKLLQSSALGI